MLARLAAQSKSRPDLSFGRALLVAALIGFWMLAISARLVFLQVSEHNVLADRAHQQQQNAIETTPQRGELLDRQERELARSVETVSLFVDPSGFKQSGDMQCTADYLSAALGLKYSDLTHQFQQAQAEGRKFLWIARRLDAAQGDRILSLNLPGLVITPTGRWQRMCSDLSVSMERVCLGWNSPITPRSPVSRVSYLWRRMEEANRMRVQRWRPSPAKQLS
jgi:cell division protein FtsI/penicillin-binding protein 2